MALSFPVEGYPVSQEKLHINHDDVQVTLTSLPNLPNVSELIDVIG